MGRPVQRFSGSALSFSLTECADFTQGDASADAPLLRTDDSGRVANAIHSSSSLAPIVTGRPRCLTLYA